MEYEIRVLERDRVTTLLVEALDEGDARRQMALRALRPLSVKGRSGGLSWHLGRRRAAFSLVQFTQELLVLLEAGLSIVESLEAMVEQERQPDTRSLLSRLLESLREGKSFSRALEELGEIVPPLYVSIVRSAERTSSLPEALTRYIDYQLRLDAVKSKVVSASIYPGILLLVGLAVTVFLLGYVVPRFAAVYQGSGRHLPWLSVQLMELGRFIGDNRITVVAGILIFIAGLAAGVRHPAFRSHLASLVQRLPLLADVVRAQQLARLYLTLGMLIDGGMPVVQGLTLMANTVSPDTRTRIAAAGESIRHGTSISSAFERSGLTTPVGMRMLRVGEQSGKMGEMMGRLARLHDGEITRFIDWFSRVFEPALMVGIGLVVGMIVVLLYMPIFDLAGSLQ